MRPIVERVGNEFAVRVNTDELDDPSSRKVAALNVRATPTLIAMHDGAEVGRLTGAASESDVRALYEAAVTGTARNAMITSTDRLLRVGTGVALAAWGLAAATPLLMAVGAAALLFGTYDLIVPGRR